MAFSPPPHRLRGHILLTREDAWALRELIRPVPFPENQNHESVNRFLDELYVTLLHIELEGRGEWNLPVTPTMVYAVNAIVKSGTWAGADAILIQSWMALQEIVFPGIVFDLPAAEAVELLTEEEADALRDEGSQTESDGQPETADSGGAELPDNDAGKRVRRPRRTKLPNVQ